MDTSLLNTCRYTGITKTSGNASEFVVCSECGGVTHTTVGTTRRTTYDLTKDNKIHSETVDIPVTDLLAQEARRCSHCGSTLPA